MTIAQRWEHIKTKFKERNKSRLQKTQIAVAKQVWKARVIVRRMRYRDKKKLPLLFLTFEELEKMLKDLPLTVFSKDKDSN